MVGFFVRRGIIRAMTHRKLRIAWSVSCSILCMLLFALWVRSCSTIDIVGRGFFSTSETTLVSIISEHGAVAFHRRPIPPGENLLGLTDHWTHHSAMVKSNSGNFLWQNQNGETWIQFPYWLPGIVIAAAAWMPWLGLGRVGGKMNLGAARRV